MNTDTQIATLLAVIADLQAERANLREENKDLDERAERYQRWWQEANAELEEARKSSDDTTPSQPSL